METEELVKAKITIISSFEESNRHTAYSLANDFTDAYLLSHKVHMPISLKAMDYWDEFSDIRNDLAWGTLRKEYNPALFFEPTSLAWSEDGESLYINIQSHSALATLDLPQGGVTSIEGYGLKRWNKNGIDLIQDDDACNLLAKGPFLDSTRNPKHIVSAEIGGKPFLFATDTGSSLEIDGYSEK